MVNVANVNRVIEAIRLGSKARPGMGFNMNYWQSEPDDYSSIVDKSGRGCGTVACIGGWCNLLEEHDTGTPRISSSRKAAEFLGIDDITAAEDLFYPDFAITTDYDSITADQAIAVLEHLRDTGEVDWARVIDRG